MPILDGASKSSHDSGKSAKMSSGRTATELVKSFQVAILHYKDDKCEKNLTNIDKIVQVIVVGILVLGLNEAWLICFQIKIS